MKFISFLRQYAWKIGISDELKPISPTNLV